MIIKFIKITFRCGDHKIVGKIIFIEIVVLVNEGITVFGGGDGGGDHLALALMICDLCY